MGEFLSDPETLNGEQRIQAREELEEAEGLLKELLHKLEHQENISERDRDIFKSRNPLDESTPIALGVLGIKHRISRERVRQVEMRVWEKLVGSVPAKEKNPLFLLKQRIESLTALVESF